MSIISTHTGNNIIFQKEEVKHDSVTSRLIKTGDNIMESGSNLDEIHLLAQDTQDTVFTIYGTLKRDGEMLASSNKKVTALKY